jgi:hypothetical protein
MKISLSVYVRVRVSVCVCVCLSLETLQKSDRHVQVLLTSILYM